ncbi:MAG TPA: PCYCGC motif-containing (lipo)protein [Candidatus Limnocylindrales bacterium]|nr:PCYCGC motif-containing (lipo)protein [Candidatus Limnocylindrales bacterium]
MGPGQTTHTIHAFRRVRCLVPLVALVLLGGTAFAACSGDHGAGATAATWTFTPDASAKGGDANPGSDPMSAGSGMSLAAANDAWDHRPSYTHVSPATEAAYAYALHNPHVVQWFPCYCGCGAMGHRSNLDCYFKPTGDDTITFEEHASYCDICVDITLKAKELIAQGVSLHDARAAIDAQFGGSVPGTPTEVPPL